MEKQPNGNKYDQEQWTQRKEKMKMEKRRQVLFRRISRIGILIVIAAAVTAAVWKTGVLTKKESGGASDPGKLVSEKDPGYGSEDKEGGKEEDLDENNEQDKNAEKENITGNQTAGPNEIPDADDKENQSETGEEGTAGNQNEHVTGETEIQNDGGFTASEDTVKLKKKIDSSNAVLISLDEGTVLASKGETKRIVPASMTKVLTLLVAVEHIQDFDKKFKITAEITDFSYKNGCSAAGFAIDEKVTVKDLMYGTILPSGADAAMGLAEYAAGSQEAFVELMNEKLRELGVSKTAHFTNCIGIFDEKHYCTVLDMAVIMKAALENDICREVLSAHTYTTSKTKQHPDGIELSNWFLRRIEDKDTGGEVVCGKTGYVDQSGNCAVSYGEDQKGRRYICVTADAGGTWKCIYDHVYLYKRFSKRKVE